MKNRFACLAVTCALLAGCAGGSGTSLTPNSASDAHRTVVETSAAGNITHVIILVQENRTLDNLFQGFPGADTVAQGLDHTGKSVPLVPTSFTEPEDPSHTYQSLHTEYDNGKMDGFDEDPIGLTILGGTYTGKDFAYGYVPQSETAIYWQLAKSYALADRMFSSEMVPSFPGHLTLIGGQSARVVGDPSDWNPMVNFVWGCDSPSGSTVDVLSAKNTILSGAGSPCLNFQTLGDLADAKNVSWKYYSGLTDGFDLDGQVSAYDAIKHIRYGKDWSTHVPQTSNREYQIFNDITAGKLPQISWLTPPALSSDHAGDLSSSGPDWVGSVVDAVEKSPYAANTAIVLTWDDSGGWYDHVAPPSYNGLNYGFRVPLIVISPYTKMGYVSHVTHDFGSILHFVESTFGLGSLGTVDASADDLSDMFDFSKPARRFSLHLPIKHTVQELHDLNRANTKIPVDSDH